MNELAKEKSPYLLQHKDNPVWWKAWTDSSIRKARENNKLIFLSIGYATCHWCHVMEHESFEDRSVAELLNTNFISIKVDREELPDVDQIYMEALQAMGQRGGWPLNVILTPDLKPVYGGTYFPKNNFITTMRQIAEMWSDDPKKLLEPAQQLFEFLKTSSDLIPGTLFDNAQLEEKILNHFESGFDFEYGGFGGAPKFPPNTQIPLILRFSKDFKNEKLKYYANETLIKMARGGIYDHIGGGFARYSVDERWEIPHFEKMLYVNALCAMNYLEMFQFTQNQQHLHVAEDILSYVLRVMQTSKSGFYSAEDADSEGREGAYYVWSYEELTKNLNNNEITFLSKNFGVTPDGNFEEFNHFYMMSGVFWESYSDPIFTHIRSKLLEIREKREAPFLDDKQLTSWNALMISSFARAYGITRKKEYLNAALQSMNFIKSTLYKNNQLYRRYRDGDVRFIATLDDYAYLIQALIELYRVTFDESWLLWASDLQQNQDKLFGDEIGYFYTAHDEKNLILRKKDFADNALPNSNGISAQNLVNLAFYFEKPEWNEKVLKMLNAASASINKYPSAFSSLLVAYSNLKNVKQLLVVESKSSERSWNRELSQSFLPNVIWGIVHSDTKIPMLQKKLVGSDKDLFYLCRRGACEAPEQELSKILSSLLS